MPHIIYVPQGRNARLVNTSPNQGFQALFTDGFSTCNIIACIGKTKIVLIHADLQTDPNFIKREIDWVDGPKETILIFREKIGEMLVAKINKALGQMINFKLKKLDNKLDGIYVSFAQQKDFQIHPNIKIFPIHKRPTNLLHHPQEQLFSAVHNIEQIIGIRAKLQTNKIKAKNTLIFDGQMWEPVDAQDLKIDSSHDITKTELGYFPKTDPLMTIAGKLGGVAVEAIKEGAGLGGDIRDMTLTIAVYLEGYLHGFNCELLFKHNMTDLLNPQNNNSIYQARKIQPSDQSHVKDIYYCLLKPSSKFIEIKAIVSKYEKLAPDTNFKELLVREFKMFEHHYKKRKYYKELSEQYAAQQNDAMALSKQGFQSFREQDYASASKSFMKALQLIIQTCPKNDSRIATLHYNIGRGQQRLGNYNEAIAFLGISLTLTQNYHKKNQASIKKAMTAIEECKSASDQTSKEKLTQGQHLKK